MKKSFPRKRGQKKDGMPCLVCRIDPEKRLAFKTYCASLGKSVDSMLNEFVDNVLQAAAQLAIKKR